ncbi:hypothetical protein [Thermogymnomonas acidicola]|uniref:hypothetical protein n=1 Tax=Thermogymnomonas acidicola TaxID=399579 RepID=UPI0009467BA6|nr:hypothetical protein [Thermogymnomonas acidicola]
MHGDAGLRLAYSSGGYTILGIFNPGKSGVEILLDGPRLVSHERFDVNGIPTDVFTVRGQRCI